MRTLAIVASCREEAGFAWNDWKIYEEPLAQPSCPSCYVFKLCTSLLQVRTVTLWRQFYNGSIVRGCRLDTTDFEPDNKWGLSLTTTVSIIFRKQTKLHRDKVVSLLLWWSEACADRALVALLLEILQVYKFSDPLFLCVCNS